MRMARRCPSPRRLARSPTSSRSWPSIVPTTSYDRLRVPTAELVSLVDTCRAYGCRLRIVPTTTALPARPRDVRAGPGGAPVRGAPAGPDRSRVGHQAGVRHRRRGAARRPSRDPGPDRGADRAPHQRRPGALPRPPRRRGRARVRDAQVPLDAAGRGRSPARAGGAQRGRGASSSRCGTTRA